MKEEHKPTDPIVAYLLEEVKWESTGNIPNPDDVPYATHSGVLHIFGHDIRCFRLSDGNTVFHADDFQAMLTKNGMGDFAIPPDPDSSHLG